MPPIARVAETIHLTVVGLWLGALVMGAAVAALIFPTMRELEPVFGLFAAYQEPHADLGAGYVQARVFFAVDLVQVVGALAGTGSLAVALAARRHLRSPPAIIRGGAFALALLAFGYQFFLLAPRMNENATAYWNAARAGEHEAAQHYQQSFAEDHPTATRTYGLIALFVAVSLVSGAWSAAGGSTMRHPPSTDDD